MTTKPLPSLLSTWTCLSELYPLLTSERLEVKISTLILIEGRIQTMSNEVAFETIKHVAPMLKDEVREVVMRSLIIIQQMGTLSSDYMVPVIELITQPYNDVFMSSLVFDVVYAMGIPPPYMVREALVGFIENTFVLDSLRVSALKTLLGFIKNISLDPNNYADRLVQILAISTDHKIKRGLLEIVAVLNVEHMRAHVPLLSSFIRDADLDVRSACYSAICTLKLGFLLQSDMYDYLLDHTYDIQYTRPKDATHIRCILNDMKRCTSRQNDLTFGDRDQPSSWKKTLDCICNGSIARALEELKMIGKQNKIDSTVIDIMLQRCESSRDLFCFLITLNTCRVSPFILSSRIDTLKREFECAFIGPLKKFRCIFTQSQRSEEIETALCENERDILLSTVSVQCKTRCEIAMKMMTTSSIRWRAKAHSFVSVWKLSLNCKLPLELVKYILSETK